MKVICFYWHGDRWQSHSSQTVHSTPSYVRNLKRVGTVSLDLSSQYVNNLFRGVTRFADREFDFICFTNEKLNLDPGIEIRKFPLVSRRGVLPRMFMFSEDAGLFGSQILCLDIDVIIVGNLEKIMAYSGLFCARSKFKLGQEDKLDGDIMSFRADKETEARFWLPFVADVPQAERLTQGRERYWVRHVAEDIADRWDQEAPGAVLSYKKHMNRAVAIPPDVSIVSCHGYPRPHQAEAAWVKNYWK